jgi:hypothetical protein
LIGRDNRLLHEAADDPDFVRGELNVQAGSLVATFAEGGW